MEHKSNKHMPESTVILGDCMDHLKYYRDKQFKLAIVDPPYFSGPEKRRFYGKAIGKRGVKRVNYGLAAEKWKVPDENYFNELFRVSEHQIIWGCNHYKFQFGPGRIIWDKVNYATSFSDCEEAYCSMHDSIRLFRYMWNGMQQGKSVKQGHIMQGNKKLNEKRIHPTQKPIALYRWTLQTYAEPGWNILSTHVGSGSDRIAAYDLGHDFMGMEIDGEMYGKEERRFHAHVHKRNSEIQFS